MPTDNRKTKSELIAELESARKRIADLEAPALERSPFDPMKLLPSVLDALDGLLVVLDPNLRVVLSNWKEHEFIPANERKGHPHCYEVFKRYNEPCNGCPALKTFRDGKPRFRFDSNPVDGGTRAVNVIPLLDADGEVCSVIEYVQDVTDRKRARDDLERFFEMSMDLICIADMDTLRFTRINPAFTKLLGYSEQELLARPFTDFVHPDDVEQSRRMAEEQLEAGKKIINFENRYIRKDGGIRWLSWISFPEPGLGTTYAIARDITPYTLAKQKLEEESLKYRQLFEMESDALFLIDSQNGAILEANKSAERMYGYSSAELLTMRNTDLSAEAEKTSKATKLKSSLVPLRYHKRKGGSVFPVEISASHFTWKNREVHLAAIRDISQRLEAERELKESEERFSLALKGSNDGIWDWNRVNDTVYFSPRWKEILGYKDHEIQNNLTEWLSRIHPDDLKHVLDANNTFYHSDAELFEVQYRMRHKDGSVRWVHGRGTCIRDEHGEPVRLVGAHSDITERKKAEEDLRASQKRLAQIIDFMPDATLVIDKEGRIIAWNRAMEILSGVPAKDMLGKGDYEYALPFYGERRPLLADLVLTPRNKVQSEYEKLELQHDSVTAEALVRHPAKGDTILWGTAAVLRDTTGKVIGAIECIRDITELKKNQQFLEQAKEAAEAANTAKSEFLANMSHEIRTPLNGILGMLQLLQMTELDGEQGNYVRTALFSGKSLLSIINDILDFSKIEAGKTELRSEVFEPGALLSTIVETFKPQAEDKGITLEYEILDAVPAKVIGDDGRIRQVLFNLLGNAVKFTDQGGVRVTLDARQEGKRSERLIYSVKDTGLGIGEDKLNKIFEPFTQIDGTLTRKHQGSGLGLSIVKRLVRLMKGDVFIKSTAGQGTDVVFDVLTKLPQKDGDAPMESDGAGIAASHAAGLEILVAEDNPVSQVFTAKILEKIGHKPMIVSNGEEALRALAGKKFDLILMDVQMPVMDGIEATAQIRGHNSGSFDSAIPIVAMTAHAMQGDREKCLQAGMDGYVSKPVDIDDLSATIQHIFAARKRCN